LNEFLVIVEDQESYSNIIYNVHGLPHVWVGQQMATMYSPSDPLFWSHHSNIDRLFAIWQDCYDYEQYYGETFPANLYTAYGSSCTPSSNYGLDTAMPFQFQGAASVAFPVTPTPRQAYFCGTAANPGPEGLFVRYASDDIANFLVNNNFCTNKGDWQYVNYGVDKKRTVNQNSQEIFNASFSFLDQQMAEAEALGLTGTEALQFVENAECLQQGPLEITPALEAWIKMEQGSVTWYDRICDNSSDRYCRDFPDSNLCMEVAEEAEEEYTFQIVAIAEAFVVVLLLIVVGVLIWKKHGVRSDRSDVDYVNLSPSSN